VKAAMTSFRTTLLGSAILATLAVLAELANGMAVFDGPRWVGILTAWISLGSCVLCLLLFVVGLFRFRFRGLWFALPMIVAWALPIYVGITLSNELEACQKRLDHPMCVP
jgi:hypothetical protein